MVLCLVEAAGIACGARAIARDCFLPSACTGSVADTAIAMLINGASSFMVGHADLVIREPVLSGEKLYRG